MQIQMPTQMQTLAFHPDNQADTLAQLPTTAAVFALYGEQGEPYVGRTPNLRGRLKRLFQPSEKHPRRLQLAGLVRRIEWQNVGSEFESLLVQFNLLEAVYSAKDLQQEALKRMHLRAPSFLRFLGSNPQPRLAVTTRPSQRESAWAFGPFQSNAAAERFSDELLKLFLLRRCTEDLECSPTHPGCVYGEMKMCLAPCQLACTPERYAEESAAVESFLATRGESRLVQLRAEREKAATNLEFEVAAEIHAQIQKVEAVAAQAAELVRPLNQQRAIVLQENAKSGSELADSVSVFLFEKGCWRGPTQFSTLGMRIQNEQSGSTSLFAQPMMLEPIPEKQPILEGAPVAAEAPKVTRDQLTERFEVALEELRADSCAPSATTKQGHLALLTRWFYRPAAKREGEIFFPDAADHWPTKAILRGVGRVAAKVLHQALDSAELSGKK
jgi:excinuclease UvrABC nuclease subunit